ncbi:MAG: MotA/TolQ/ExbB proton channel family protein [Bdellovibrionales bacterium]|nr:MotA/TolQ/ExbB proton channel family protein [Bdellovibrionales bacterium]
MLEQVSDFLSSGGKVLWFIFFSLISLCYLVLERFYYFYRIFPEKKRKVQSSWLNREDKKSWFALKIRDEELSKLTRDMFRFVSSIKTIVLISPLLGLLGTVTGMISIFDILSFSGTGNPRLMASGISLAVIPTMAGLVTALIGMYFSSYFEKKGKREKEKIVSSLKF